MLRIREYIKVKSVDEAYDLLQKNKKNRVIGGMLWLRLQDTMIPVGIDLSDCDLNRIEETEKEVKIGAMVTLRELETNSVIAELYGGIIGKSVADIVGVQFRNMATIGGSIYSRFGFSDILTALLALPVDVVLHQGGRMSLQEFVNHPKERDVLTHIIVKKEAGKACYLSERRSATDFPVLAVAVANIGDAWNISIGARPAKAQLLTLSKTSDFTEKEMEELKRRISAEFTFGSNMRGSRDYREILAVTLTERGIKMIQEGCR